MKKIDRMGFLSSATVVALILAAGMGAPAASGGPKNQIKAFMISSGVDADARGRILVVTNKAQSFFMIQVQNLDPNSPYDIAVNGTTQESLTTNSGGEGKVTHRMKKNGPPLSYDPRSTRVEVASGGTVYLSADVPATPQDAQALVEIRLDLTPGISVLGTAHADFKSRFGRMKFSVETENAAPGAYDLFVGGSNVGTITVDAAGAGKLEFDSRPSSDADGTSDGLDLLLTFDPRGQTIEIQQAGVAIFSGIFPLVP